MKMDGLRKIPKKNYIILGVVIAVTILILYYFYMWVDVYKESKINIPIMDKYMSVINYNELSDYIVENPNTIVYVSVLENEEVREFEKKFKNKYKNNLVEQDVLYMNITDEFNDKNIKKDMASKYSLNNLNITDVPSLLVFNDGILKSIYSVSDNNYDIDRFIIYLNNIVLESDDI
ncbi:MAG: hypothetical protein IJE89_01380 [Bacilli bacterium]|nr:hypothetical protein [Bacilli bacterium]